MYRVNHPFLFRGKRYKSGQLLSDDHTAVRYRTQFVDHVEEDVVEAPSSASTEASETEIPAPGRVVQPGTSGVGVHPIEVTKAVEVIPEKPHIPMHPQYKQPVKPVIVSQQNQG